MKLQGSSGDEPAFIQVETLGATTLQEIHRKLKDYFAGEKKLEVFEILSAVKTQNNWELRCLIEYSDSIRIVGLFLAGKEAEIVRMTEEFRAEKNHH